SGSTPRLPQQTDAMPIVVPSNHTSAHRCRDFVGFIASGQGLHQAYKIFAPSGEDDWNSSSGRRVDCNLDFLRCNQLQTGGNRNSIRVSAVASRGEITRVFTDTGVDRKSKLRQIPRQNIYAAGLFHFPGILLPCFDELLVVKRPTQLMAFGVIETILAITEKFFSY